MEYQCYFYRNRDGVQPLVDYIRELKDKKKRYYYQRLNRIQEMLRMVSRMGTQCGHAHILHVEGNIWTMSPYKELLLFVAVVKDQFFLLHHYRRSSHSVPKREVDAARTAYLHVLESLLQEESLDVSRRIDSAIGTSWADLEQEVFSCDEMLEANMRTRLIQGLITARTEKGLTYKELEGLSGVREIQIYRMEKGLEEIQLSNLLQLLAPLGKTLDIVPLQQLPELDGLWDGEAQPETAE